MDDVKIWVHNSNMYSIIHLYCILYNMYVLYRNPIGGMRCEKM